MDKKSREIFNVCLVFYGLACALVLIGMIVLIGESSPRGSSNPSQIFGILGFFTLILAPNILGIVILRSDYEWHQFFKRTKLRYLPTLANGIFLVFFLWAWIENLIAGGFWLNVLPGFILPITPLYLYEFPMLLKRFDHEKILLESFDIKLVEEDSSHEA